MGKILKIVLLAGLAGVVFAIPFTQTHNATWQDPIPSVVQQA